MLFRSDQNNVDSYGRYPALVAGASEPQAAGHAVVKGDAPATLTYDRAKGASRAHNDAGIMDIPTHYIAGYVWHDANYDGVYNDGATDKFTVGGATYTEAGMVGKKVILKQWYFKPAADGNGGQWIQKADFDNGQRAEEPKKPEVPTDPTDPANPVDPADDPATAVMLAAYPTFAAPTLSEAGIALADAAGAGTPVTGNVEVSTLTMEATTIDGDKVRDGYYRFDKLPVYVAVDGTEYLAGYTVEVLGGTDGMAVNFPVTKMEETRESDGTGVTNDNDQNSTAQVIGTELVNGDGVTYAAADGGDVFANTNYPLLWANRTGQGFAKDTHNAGWTSADGAEKVGPVANSSVSTLDGMIVLAGNTTDFTQDDNYKVAATRGAGDNATTVAFDMATGRDEDNLSAGYGYFGTTEVSGYVWYDANFNGVREVTAGATVGEKAISGQEVRLTQWYYLDGELSADKTQFIADAKTYTTTAGATAALRGDLTAGMKTFDATDAETLEVVYEADGTTVRGAWIRNMNFGDLSAAPDPDPTPGDGDGAGSGTVAPAAPAGGTPLGYARAFTEADGDYRFGDLLPYVQFDAEGNPLTTAENVAKATDDMLAIAAYRVVLPELPESHVLTLYQSGQGASNNDSDAKRDVLRTRSEERRVGKECRY